MIHYKNKNCAKMTEQEINACSKLFSENYGVWSNVVMEEKRRGQPIRMSPSLIKIFGRSAKDYLSKIGTASSLRAALSHRTG